MSLKSDIAAWDAKSKDAISGVYERHVTRSDFVGQLVSLMGREDLQTGATWLLKHHLETGNIELDEETAHAIFTAATTLTPWEARLHVLQCMDYITIPKSGLQAAETFIRTCLEDDAKFVRAWAYNGFHRMAEQHEIFRDEATELLNDAMQREQAGSIRARIRHALKRGFPQTATRSPPA